MEGADIVYYETEVGVHQTRMSSVHYYYFVPGRRGKGRRRAENYSTLMFCCVKKCPLWKTSPAATACTSLVCLSYSEPPP